MDLLEPYHVLPLSTDGYLLYKGIAFDGCFFYLTMPKTHHIYRFNEDFELSATFEVNRPYNCICYDNTEHCFWASVDKINTMIYKLDCNLKEIDFIRLSISPKYSSVNGLSYNCETNSLFAAFSNFIVNIQKDGNTICLLTSERGCFNGVLSISPYYLVSLLSDNTQSISVYDHSGYLIASYCLTGIYRVEDMLFYPWDGKDKEFITLYILATKHCCYPRLLKCKLDNKDFKLCCCNYDFPPECFMHKSREQCTNDIIESIALEEAALSHILNELGSKLQKSTEMADSICDMLEVNKAVNKTIMNITQLEHILYAKMEALNSFKPNSCGRDKSS